MAGFSNYQRDRVLDFIFNGAVYSPEATLYAALTTVAITASLTGSTITEATYTGYARVAVTCNATNWPVAVDGAMANGTAVTFAECTGGSDTVTHFCLCSANVNGQVIAYGSLSPSRAIESGDVPEFAIGDFDIQLT
jgi:hypothetical protein